MNDLDISESGWIFKRFISWGLIVALLAAIPLVIPTTSPTKAYQSCGIPRKMPVKVFLDKSTTPPQGVTMDQVDQALNFALDTWTALPDSDIRFERVGAAAEAHHVVSFWSVDYVIVSSTCPQGAQTNTRVSNSSKFLWDKDPGDGISGDAYSIHDVLTHEMGHALSLHHSCTPDADAIMCAPLPKGKLRSIGSDAQRAMATFYPVSGPPVPTSPPTPTPSPSPTPTPTPITKILVLCEKVIKYSDGSVRKITLPLSDCGG